MRRSSVGRHVLHRSRVSHRRHSVHSLYGSFAPGSQVADIVTLSASARPIVRRPSWRAVSPRTRGPEDDDYRHDPSCQDRRPLVRAPNRRGKRCRAVELLRASGRGNGVARQDGANRDRGPDRLPRRRRTRPRGSSVRHLGPGGHRRAARGVPSATGTGLRPGRRSTPSGGDRPHPSPRPPPRGLRTGARGRRSQRAPQPPHGARPRLRTLSSSTRAGPPAHPPSPPRPTRPTRPCSSTPAAPPGGPGESSRPTATSRPESPRSPPHGAGRPPTASCTRCRCTTSTAWSTSSRARSGPARPASSARALRPPPGTAWPRERSRSSCRSQPSTGV